MRKLRSTTLQWLVATSVLGCSPRPFSGNAFQAEFSEPEIGEAILPSGVRVFLERDPQGPVVSVGWMVPAGRTSDPPSKAGLAHLTEHLVFQAPRQGGATAIEFYNESGVQFRGETDAAATRFSVTAHRERFRDLLKFELGRIADPLSSLGEKDVRREIRILHEETASLRPPWQRDAMNSLFRALFPQGSPLVREANEEASLETLTIEDARQFVAAHYRLKTMQLFVVGDFSWAEAEALLGTTMRGRSQATHDAAQPAAIASPPLTRPIDRMLQQRGFVPENILQIGWALPSHLDMVGIEPLLVPLVNSVLPRIEASSHGRYPEWMPQGAQGQKSVELVSTQQGSAIVVTAQLPPEAEAAKTAVKIITAVDSLAAKIGNNPSTFALVQFKVTQSRLQETEDVDYRISRLMTQHSMGDMRPSQKYFTDMNAVTPSHAARFTGAWLSKALARVMLISPAQPKESETLLVRVPAKQGSMSDPPAVAMGASPKAPFSDGRFVWRKLPNGVELAVLSRPMSTINTLLLGVRSTARNPDLEPIDSFVSVARETLPCPSSAMACIDGVDGASFRSMVSSLGDGTPQAARYLLAVAAAPHYEWTAAVKDWLGPLLEKREAMPEAIARRELQSVLWGSHPKGKRVSSELLRRMTLNDLLQWEHANIRPENALVIAVTNKSADSLADTIGADLQRWIVRRSPPRLPVSPALDLTKTHALRILYATDPGLESARFHFGCLMPPLKSFADRAAAKMVGDWMYRVLFAQLRNQSDASYATATRVNAYSSGETSMLGTMDVNLELLGPAIARFRDLFDRPHEFAGQEIDHMKELRRRRVALQNLIGTEVAAEIFDRWSFHMGNPTPLGEFEEIRRVTASDLNAIWNVCRQNAVLQVRTKRPLRVDFEN
jgi:predicted Zn-dependent peptidase